MKSFRDLEIYQISKQLAVEIHLLSMTLPKFEMYEEGSQIRRSSKAVTSLLVEGYERRRYKADFIKYLVYCQSECDETIVHLDFLYETKFLSNTQTYEYLKDKYQQLSRRINKFITWVENNLNDFSSK